MEDEIQRKHLEKKKLRKEIRSISIQLKPCLTILVYTVLLQKINVKHKNNQKKLLSYRNDIITVMKLLTFRKI